MDRRKKTVFRNPSMVAARERNTMPKKVKADRLPDFSKEKITEMPVSEMLKSNFMPYAMSVIVSRAIPEIDGLKPSHRKILYTMYDMGLLTGGRTKSANIAARTMLLNPHGDASAYEAMVRLTQNNETLLTPLVDGKGNFGKHYSRDMAYAASRYTEAKLAPAAGEFFRDIKKDTVDFVDNYDSTRKEPVLLPVSFPNILANPTEGIAVGMASSIPSFNLRELCKAAAECIKNPDADLTEIMPGPDFTTGGYLVYDRDAMKKIYQTGRGSVRLRSKYTVDNASRVIEVTEIPYTTTAEAIIDSIIALVKNGKASEVSDVRNETDLGGLKIAIDYKRSTDPEKLMQKLMRLTKLEDTFSFNMTILIDGYPKVLGVNGILNEWLSWRRGCVNRRLSFDLVQTESELHRLEGFEKILLDIDKAIRIIRETDKDSMVIQNLMSGFSIDEEQASFIADIKLRNLNKEYLLEKTKKADDLRKARTLLTKEIGNTRAVNRIIVKELESVAKKYGKDRKTEILDATSVAATAEEETIDNYRVMMYRTRDGYIKKVPVSSLKSSPEIKVKGGDEIVQSFEAENTSELLFFTDRCNAYKLFAYELADSRPSELGGYLHSILGLEEDENAVYACVLDGSAFLLIGFRNGKAVKLPLSVYKTKTKRKKLKNAYFDGSTILNMFSISSDSKFGMLSSKGKLLIFDSKDVSEKTTKTSQGIQVLRLSSKVEAVQFEKADYFHVGNGKGFGYRHLPAAGGTFVSRADSGQMSMFDA